MAQISIQMKTEKWKIRIQTSVRRCSLAFFWWKKEAQWDGVTENTSGESQTVENSDEIMPHSICFTY